MFFLDAQSLVGKARSLPKEQLQGEQLWWAPTLHLNISFGWKCLPGTKQTNLYYLLDEVEKLYIFIIIFYHFCNRCQYFITFFFVFHKDAEKARVFVLGKPSLVSYGQKLTLTFSSLTLVGSCLTPNVRFGWKCLSGTNTLVLFFLFIVDRKKSFITLTYRCDHFIALYFKKRLNNL